MYQLTLRTFAYDLILFVVGSVYSETLIWFLLQRSIIETDFLMYERLAKNLAGTTLSRQHSIFVEAYFSSIFQSKSLSIAPI